MSWWFYIHFYVWLKIACFLKISDWNEFSFENILNKDFILYKNEKYFLKISLVHVNK